MADTELLESPSWADTFLGGFVEQIEGLKGNDRAAFDNLEFFSEYVMGYDNPYYRKNSQFLRRVLTMLQYTDDNLLILGPRNSAKSTAVTVTYTAWKIGRNPLMRYMLCFATKEEQGYAFVRILQKILTENDRYKQIFGDLKPPNAPGSKWAADEFIVRRNEPPGGLKDATVSVCGISTSVPSKRADEVICDDVVTQDGVLSELQRNRTEQFVDQSLFPILVPGGRKIIVGSRWHEDDLYARVARKWGLTIPEPPQYDYKKLLSYKKEPIEVDLESLVASGASHEEIARIVAEAKAAHGEIAAPAVTTQTPEELLASLKVVSE